MGLGLAGEAMEVLELTAFDGPLDFDHAKKELGDVMFYWAIICVAIGSDPSELWNGAPTKILEPAPDRRGIEKLAIELALSTGRAAEAFKKIIRDHSGPDLLAERLSEVSTRWARLCHALGFDCGEVIAANKAKVDDRSARGVLRGNGNDR